MSYDYDSGEVDGVPFIAVGNNELVGRPKVRKGDKVKCPDCSQFHPIEYGKNKETGEEMDTIGFIHCKESGKSYMASLGGVLAPHVEEKDFKRAAKNIKFILIISAEIDKYIAWASEERKLHKAQVVRMAIEDTMAKDLDYQRWLKEQS